MRAELSEPQGLTTPTRRVLLEAGARRLAAFSDSPRLDAELLLAHSLGCPRTGLYAHAEQAIVAADAARFDALVTRRLAGEPVAYLIGTAEFWSLTLRVGPQVLVPRPETELLVEWGLACIAELDRPRLADLGTGSGAIALALAAERPDARIVAIDRSQAALELARDNAMALGLSSVRFCRTDWVRALGGTYDLVVSNPPYVERGDPRLQSSVARFEPAAALYAEDHGLAALRELAAGVPPLLASGGWLLCEHGPEQAAAVRAAFVAAGLEAVCTRRDLAGHERATGGRRPAGGGRR